METNNTERDAGLDLLHSNLAVAMYSGDEDLILACRRSISRYLRDRQNDLIPGLGITGLANLR